MNDTCSVLPHDLLWGFSAQDLAPDAPAWAAEALGAGQPVVVRRALASPGWVAVGVRGRQREQRYACQMRVAAIERRVSPEQLTRARPPLASDWPALVALRQLKVSLDEQGWVWGVTGSAGFELASGFAALHEDSDLDLMMRMPESLSRTRAAALLTLLDGVGCRVDLQLQTPNGAVALREWAGSASRVLLKRAAGAVLVSDPWLASEQAT